MSTSGCSCRYRSSLGSCSGGPGGTSGTSQYRYPVGGQRNSFPKSQAIREPGEVVAQLGEAFRARLLGEASGDFVFRHQLVHDAIYQEIPVPVRRVMHRDAAGALASAGAGLLQVADHLVRGAARGICRPWSGCVGLLSRPPPARRW